LGNTLANLDIQSDNFRQSIERHQAVRKHYKKMYILFKLTQLLDSVYSSIPEISNTKRTINSIDTRTPKTALLSVQKDLFSIFNTPLERKENRDGNYKKWASVALFVIGIRSGKKHVINSAREALLTWEQDQCSVLGVLHSIGISALVNFFGNDIITAISESERALVYAKDNISNVLDEDKDLCFNCYSSIISSLSYYHADLIGSHEGQLHRSSQKAEDMLDLLSEVNNEMAHPLPTPFGNKKEIRLAIEDGSRGTSNFMCLDNELYVRIQISNNFDDVRKLYDILEFIHKCPPHGVSIEAGLLWQYHDYCAKAHIMELEKDYLGSSHP